ncbi:MAG: serine/threonine-protein kinase [Myxococcota bacterium]
MSSLERSPVAVSGESFGRYRLIDKLATGGMAELFLAKTSVLPGVDKIVALKRTLPHLRHDETMVSMFLDEARVAARLEHPNIVDVYDVDRVGPDYFFTMAYLHGEDLSAVMRTLGRGGQAVPHHHALHIVQGICAGLHHAHEQVGLDGRPLRIVHRDISTSNVMLTFDGEIKLLDFGIAKASNQSCRTQAGVRKGKAAYMSPEQCRGEPLDRRSDVFSIGLVLWELTTMRRLFRAPDPLVVMNQIAHHPAPRPSTVLPDYPKELERIVMRALAHDREDRYPTARALQNDLQRYARAQPLRSSTGALAKFMLDLFGYRPRPWASERLVRRKVPDTTAATAVTRPDLQQPARTDQLPTASTDVGGVATTPPGSRRHDRWRLVASGVGGAALVTALAMTMPSEDHASSWSPAIETTQRTDPSSPARPEPTQVRPREQPPLNPCPAGMVLVGRARPSTVVGTREPAPLPLHDLELRCVPKALARSPQPGVGQPQDLEDRP